MSELPCPHGGCQFQGTHTHGTDVTYGPRVSRVQDVCAFCDPEQLPADREHVTNFGVKYWIFAPKNPVVEGHLLVVPEPHVTDSSENSALTGGAFAVASVAARHKEMWHYNLISSKGVHATETVEHLHVHLIPRAEGDGLHLPWTGQRAAEEAPFENLGTEDLPMILSFHPARYPMEFQFQLRHAHYNGECVKNIFEPPAQCQWGH